MQTGRAAAGYLSEGYQGVKTGVRALTEGGARQTASRAWQYSKERLNPLNYKIERKGWDVNVRFSEVKLGSYGELNELRRAGKLGSDVQAHHLNQNAVFKPVIPQDEGASIALHGNAFTESGTPHYEFHRSLEGFWNQFRRGGSRFPDAPTNAEYGAAVETALRDAGLPRRQASRVAAYAREQREAYGLLEQDPVIRVPGRINQSGGETSNNFPTGNGFVVPPPAIFGLRGNEE